MIIFLLCLALERDQQHYSGNSFCLNENITSYSNGNEKLMIVDILLKTLVKDPYPCGRPFSFSLVFFSKVVYATSIWIFAKESVFCILVIL